MGAFDNVNRTITIPRTPEEGKAWEWDSHESVTLRFVATAYDESWVTNHMMRMVMTQKEQGTQADVDSNVGAAKILWICRMLVSWTFTQNGMPVALPPLDNDELHEQQRIQVVGSMKTEYIDRMYDEMMAARKRKEAGTEDLQNFTNNASNSTGAGKSRNYLSKS